MTRAALNELAAFYGVAVAIVVAVVAVALRIVTGVLRFAGTYPRLTVTVVGLWWLVEVAQ